MWMMKSEASHDAIFVLLGFSKERGERRESRKRVPRGKSPHSSNILLESEITAIVCSVKL